MKKLTQRTLWLAAVIAMIGIGVTGCVDPNGNDTTTPDPCANGHAFPEWIAPTCIAEGNSERACTRSGCTAADTRTTGFAMLDHDWEYDADATPPTCTTVGRGHRHCKDCPADEEGGTYSMLPHKWEWDVTEPPTCVFAGVKVRECEDCEAEETDEVGIDEDEHDIEVIGEGLAPTCLLPGHGTIRCKRGDCNYSETGDTITKRGHNFVEHWDVFTTPTCTTAGVEERFCTHDFCDKIEDPNNAENHYRQTRPIAALGHQGTIAAFAATCTTAGNSALSGNCIRFAQCGQVVTGTVTAALGHTGTVTPFAATCTTPGNSAALSGNCVRFAQCGHVVTGTVTAALGHAITSATLVNENIITLTDIAVNGTCSRCAETSFTITLAEYIQAAAQTGTAAATAVPLKVSINLGTMGTAANGWTQLLAALDAGGKLVNLDLSDSTMTTAANSFITGVSRVDWVSFFPDGINRIASITLPNTAESIGNLDGSFQEMGFSGCTNLTSVTIGNSVQTIGNQAFQNCTGLTSITIGNNVTSIGVGAFANCPGLTSITIPASVTSIGVATFWGTGLVSVTFQRADTTIGGDDSFPIGGASLITAYTAGGIGTYTTPNHDWDSTWTKQ